jgi:uncharacterized MAPEG superfamily protein
MTTELTFTLLTAILATSLWIPFVAGLAQTDAEFLERPADVSKLPAWVHRAQRAHMNLVEQFVPFAAIVLIGHAAGASSVWYGWLAIAFFAIRCLHAVFMFSGKTKLPLRPIAFTAGWVVTMIYAVLLLV